MVERVASKPNQVGPDLESQNWRRILAYDPDFDIEAQQKLYRDRTFIGELEFERRQDQLNLRIRHNLETNLGDRFNVELTQVFYTFDTNDNLKSQEHDEPFLVIIRRGQKFRQDAGSDEVVREKAEVEGFAILSKILLDSQGESLLEKKVIIISPRGGPDSVYQHNFFDIYQKNEDGTVALSRYTSKLSYEEFWQVIQKLDPSRPTPIVLTDAYFLAHPIITTRNSQELLEMFSPQEDTLSLQEYNKLIEACSPLISAYINVLAQNPDKTQIKKIYNSILNFADFIILGKYQQTPYLHTSKGISLDTSKVESTIDFYGSFHVRQVMTGCGPQIGFTQGTNYQLSVTNYSPFSVAEFGSESCAECGGNSRHFHCPGCRGQIPSGQGITVCPHCHLTKEQVGSQC